MPILIPESDFHLFKNIPCKCEVCHQEYTISRTLANRCIKGTKNVRFCSVKCFGLGTRSTIKSNCVQCNAPVLRTPSSIEKSGNSFCTRSCAALYNNAHKKHGTRQSKLERWLQQQLSVLFPNLEIHYNRRDTIKMELDIFIPSLKLAFELNGLFHYKSVFGLNKLNKIVANDVKRQLLCEKQNIFLHIIDTSQQRQFKPDTSYIFLDYIIQTIKNVKSVYPLSQSNITV